MDVLAVYHVPIRHSQWRTATPRHSHAHEQFVMVVEGRVPLICEAGTDAATLPAL
ncbi:hypothetical protein [Azospirillum lipoferum]|uniref:hypothetical protein n=1 Tax=Azospirillum lipoferum TaxID=193 RepID=UPI0002E89619|nr:hypothetical protein [Azospirillum lipoferum]